MRAALIGGNGFIGSHLVDLLLAENWQVSVFSRSPEHFRTPLADVEYILDNVENVAALADCISRADIVFHLAVTTVPQTSNAAPIFDVQSNLVSALHLLNICARSGVKNLVFLSSGGTVYGVPSYLPVDEEHPTEPISSYGIVKLAIEKYVQLFGRLYGLTYTIVRPSNPFGPRQDPNGKQGVIAILMRQILQKEPIKLLGYGNIMRDYVYVTDLARACYLAACRTNSTNVYNIGSGVGTTLNELCDLIEEISAESLCQIERLPLRPFDVPKIVLNNDLARRELLWTPQVSLRDGLRITWDWVKMHQQFLVGSKQDGFKSHGQRA